MEELLENFKTGKENYYWGEGDIFIPHDIIAGNSEAT